MSNSITTKRNILPKSVTSIAVVAVIIGIVLLIAVSILNKDTANWIETSATIVDFDKSSGDPAKYNTIVSYIFDSVSYENIKLSFYDGANRIGDIIKIKCNPIDPTHIVISQSALFLVLQILGGMAIGVGAILPLIYFIIIIIKKNHINHKNNNTQQRKNDEPRVFIINTEDQNNAKKEF